MEVEMVRLCSCYEKKRNAYIVLIGKRERKGTVGIETGV
jgi:hypothetical protein